MARRQAALVRIAGIPIYIDASWLLIFAFVSWTLATGYFPGRLPGASALAYGLMGFVSALLLFVCVLSHELGHSLLAKASGIPVARVVLFVFGGVAHIGSSPRRPLTELKIAIAGPLVSLGIAALCLWLSAVWVPQTYGQQIAWAILRYVATVNIALIIFNLLPGLPLDGGRILRAILWALTKDPRKATRISATVGQGLGIALIVMGAFWLVRGDWINGMWYGFLGMFLRQAACASLAEASS